MPIRDRNAPWRATSICAAVLTVGAGATTLMAHDDDPKANSILPKFEGPGWRRAIDGKPGMAGGPMSANGGFDSENVTLRSWVTINEFAGSHSIANDIWGYTSPSGREYAIVGLECGNGFVEITDPDNAVVVATIAGPCSTWGDIKVFGHHVYAVTESNRTGIQVIDVSDIDNGNVTLAAQIEHQQNRGRSHNVVIDTTSGYLYRVGGYYNGFGCYDLNADPENPPLVTSWSDRYIHDAQVVTYADGPYAGRQIMFAASGENGGWENGRLEIIDVTDKGDTFTVEEAFYTNTVYSHQVWVDAERQYAYLNDELDERETGTDTATRIFDISDLTSVTEVGTFGNGLRVIDHNLFVRGDFIFEANYTSGLRVYDACDRENPVEVGYFDTRPEGNETDFFALWGNFPFFDSGLVVGSDEQRGLFVWSIDVAPGCGADCPGDFDESGSVDFNDLIRLLSQWGPCENCPEDLDDNDVVDFGDLVTLLALWGDCK